MPVQEVFSRTVDIMFNRMGTEALYNDGEISPFTILVIPQREHELLELGEGRIHTEDANFMFRVNEVATPQCGDEITINGRTYTIEEQPRKDQHQLIWSAETLPY